MADITGYEEVIVEIGGAGFADVQGLDQATADQLYASKAVVTALQGQVTANQATATAASNRALDAQNKFQDLTTNTLPPIKTAADKGVADAAVAKTAADAAQKRADDAYSLATVADRETKTVIGLPNNPFVVGDVLVYSGGAWQKAIANPVSSPWYGVVGEGLTTLQQGNNFAIVTAGRVPVTPPAGVTLAVGMMLYLSRTVAGAWQTAAPAATEFDAFRQAVVVISLARPEIPAQGTRPLQPAVPAYGLIIPFKRRLSPFRPVTTQPTGAGDIRVIHSGAGMLLCGKGNRVYDSDDGGETWALAYTQTNANLTQVWDMANVGAAVWILFGASANVSTAQPWVTTLNGTTYAAGSAWQANVQEARAILTAGGYNWVGVSSPGTSFGAIVYRTTGTSTAFALYTGIGASRRKNIYAMIADATYVYVASDNGEIYRLAFASADASAIYAQLPAAVMCFALNGATMLAGTAQGKVHSSPSPYSAWSAGVQLAGATVVNCIQPHRGNIFAGADSGVYVSADNGATWALIYPGMVTAMYSDGAKLIAAIGGSLYIYGA